MRKIISAFVTTLLLIGVVIGAWRVLGDGANITDPEWPKNAYENVREWFDDTDDSVTDRTKSLHAPLVGDREAPH